TSTRALMARWGRTTDIEYLYKAFLDDSGKLLKATIQSRNHQEIEFDGKRDGAHPLLMPVTDNNMVAGGESSSIRYQIAPLLVDLPPGTKPEQIAEIGFECLVAPPERGQPIARSGACRLESVSKAFLLNDAAIPGPSVFSMGSPVEIPTGETAIFPR